MSLFVRSSLRSWAPVALALVLVAAARADIAPDPLNGGVTMKPFGSDTSVAMTEETVDLVLEPEKLAVTARFTLHNTGKAHELQVGFPMIYKGELQDFVAKVNGVAVATSQEVKAIPGSKKPRQEHWVVWKMSFAAGKKEAVEVTYWVRPHQDMLRIHNMIREWFGDREKDKRFAPLTAGYVLVTGAPWKGPIGKAVVNLRFAGGLTARHLQASSPAGAKEADGVLTWTFKDFEPTEDIRFTFGRMAVAEEIAEYEKIAGESGALWAKLRLADLHEAAGDRKKALDLYATIIPEVPAAGTVRLDDEFSYSYVDFCEKAVALGKGVKEAGAAAPVRGKVKKFLSALLAGKVVHPVGGRDQPIRVSTTPEKKRVEKVLAAVS